MKLPAIALLCYAPLALANDPHRDPPKPVVIIEHEHDHNALALVTGGLVSYWVVRHYHRLHPKLKDK